MLVAYLGVSLEEGGYLHDAVEHQLHVQAVALGLLVRLDPAQRHPEVQVPLVLMPAIRKAVRIVKVSRWRGPSSGAQSSPGGGPEGLPGWLLGRQGLAQPLDLLAALLLEPLLHLALQLLPVTFSPRLLLLSPGLSDLPFLGGKERKGQTNGAIAHLAAWALRMAARLLPRGGRIVVIAEVRLFSEGSGIPRPRATESLPRLSSGGIPLVAELAPLFCESWLPADLHRSRRSRLAIDGGSDAVRIISIALTRFCRFLLSRRTEKKN